jgi:hypothetical protein
LHDEQKLVLNIAQRGKTTQNNTLEAALHIAKGLYAEAKTVQLLQTADEVIIQSYSLKEYLFAPVVFNVQNHITEPLLNVADYFCWAVQRVFEKGEIRYYNYLKNKICSVVDLYDWNNSASGKNRYNCNNPLTAGLKIDKPTIALRSETDRRTGFDFHAGQTYITIKVQLPFEIELF